MSQLQASRLQLQPRGAATSSSLCQVRDFEATAGASFWLQCRICIDFGCFGVHSGCPFCTILNLHKFSVPWVSFVSIGGDRIVDFGAIRYCSSVPVFLLSYCRCFESKHRRFRIVPRHMSDTSVHVCSDRLTMTDKNPHRFCHSANFCTFSRIGAIGSSC